MTYWTVAGVLSSFHLCVRVVMGGGGVALLFIRTANIFHDVSCSGVLVDCKEGNVGEPRKRVGCN